MRQRRKLTHQQAVSKFVKPYQSLHIFGSTKNKRLIKFVEALSLQNFVIFLLHSGMELNLLEI